ncbi:MAG: DUF3011 domain-containing protein [Acidobacteriota bacterium]
MEQKLAPALGLAFLVLLAAQGGALGAHQRTSIELCQEAIGRSIEADFGRRAQPRFQSGAETHTIGVGMVEVGGEMSYWGGRRRERADYSCRVDIRRRRVVEARYGRENTMRLDSLIRACQEKIREEVEYDRGGNTELRFEAGAETSLVARGEREVRGRAALRERGDWQPFSYDCTLEIRVADAHYRVDERPRGEVRDTKLECKSKNYRHRTCSIRKKIPRNARIVAVDFEDQDSRAPCVEGQSYGIDLAREIIWVDKGCDADFRVTYEKP